VLVVVGIASKEDWGRVRSAASFLLAEFSLVPNHRHGLLHIEQFEIAKTPQREIIFLGHLSKCLIIHSAIFAECLNAHVLWKRGPAFWWRQQNGFHLST
jgi:hypothetical protein